jgi:hypothetical protein
VFGNVDLGNSLRAFIAYLLGHNLDEIQERAREVKRRVQLLIGTGVVVLLVPYTLFTLLSEGEFDPLRIVGVGLLFSTAIELAFLLFTPGPDEALDPVITGIAGILLYRAPVTEAISYGRIAEMGVYAVIIASLVLVRGPFFKGEQERERLEATRQSAERDR